MYVCKYVYLCICVRMYACTYVRMCVYIYTYYRGLAVGECAPGMCFTTHMFLTTHVRTVSRSPCIFTTYYIFYYTCTFFTTHMFLTTQRTAYLTTYFTTYMYIFYCICFLLHMCTLLFLLHILLHILLHSGLALIACVPGMYFFLDTCLVKMQCFAFLLKFTTLFYYTYFTIQILRYRFYYICGLAGVVCAPSQ